nr:beta-D-galactosidase fusion protein [synthetic construct]
MTMITPSAQLTLTKGNKSWVPGPPSRSTVSISLISNSFFFKQKDLFGIFQVCQALGPSSLRPTAKGNSSPPAFPFPCSTHARTHTHPCCNWVRELALPLSGDSTSPCPSSYGWAALWHTRR